MRKDIEFRAEDGVTLRGWLYVPDTGSDPHPTVVMAHGFSAVKEQTLEDLAAVLCDAGLACVVYDHRNLGASDGEPLQEIAPVAQVRDMRTAITYAETVPECTVRSIDLALAYDVTPYLPRIAPTPLLMILTEEDTTTPTDLALEAFALAREPKQLVIVPGHHYRVYVDAFDRSSAAARGFLTERLGAPSAG